MDWKAHFPPWVAKATPINTHASEPPGGNDTLPAYPFYPTDGLDECDGPGVFRFVEIRRPGTYIVEGTDQWDNPVEETIYVPDYDDYPLFDWDCQGAILEVACA